MSRTATTSLLIITMFTYDFQQVLAQAPINDIISWPSGMLLLASVLYAALGSSPQRLFEIEPLTGLCLFNGLPQISVPTMRKVNWVANSAHFMSNIKRTAYGKFNFWIRTEDVSSEVRSDALTKIVEVMGCCVLEDRGDSRLDEKRWRKSSTPGMIIPTIWAPSPPTLKSPSTPPPPPPQVTSRDFLLWAAIEYHVFHDWHVDINSHGSLIYTTQSKPASTIVDVDSIESAIPVVASQMIRRPHSQTMIRQLAAREDGDDGPYVLELDNVDLDAPACYIDFHSYAPEKAKVSASLRELATAYYTVVQHIKQQHQEDEDEDTDCPLFRVAVGQSIWISILGGSLFSKNGGGRLTIQNLPGRWGCLRPSADEMYFNRITAVLELISPYTNTPAFNDLIYSNGLSRRTATPFLISSIIGQVLICYFICVATTAGLWTSVALSNVIYAGKLTDWHSMWLGKTPETDEPGFKMYLPGTKDLMCIATLNPTAPRQGDLRQGFLLNLFGLISAILGSIFTTQTRTSLGFEESQPTRAWVVYTSIALCLGISLLILITIILQQVHEKTWRDHSEIPTRWMILSTIPTSFIISGMGLYFQMTGQQYLWPVCDALVWVTGIPLGMLENGRMISVDENTLHMVLLNRWIMGAVASSLGSSIVSSA